MKNIIVALSVFASASAFAATETLVHTTSCSGHKVEVYFTPADQLIAHAEYTGTETGDGLPKEGVRTVGLFFDSLGKVRISIDGNAGTTSELGGAIYNTKLGGGIVQQDSMTIRTITGKPILGQKALSGKYDFSVQAQDWSTAMGVMTVGIQYTQVGPFAATGSGTYKAEYDYSKITTWYAACFGNFAGSSDSN